MALDLEVGVRALHVLERVDIGHQMTAHAEGVDQLLHPRLLVDALGEVDGDVGVPADGGVRDAQSGEDVVVEAALTDEQLVHLLEELAGARSLDDAVVVGAGERDGLADRQLVERLLARTLELGRVLEGAGADDAALALHQTRHRMHGADAARVGERHRGALEVARGQLVAACARDQVLVSGEVLGERQRVGALDAGHHEGARAVGLGQVDRDAEVDMRRRHHGGLAVDLCVEHVLAAELVQRADERPADEVGEADLAAASARHVVVDDDAVVDHQLRRHGAHTGGGRDGERLVHVRRECLGQTAKGRDLVFFDGSRSLRRLGLRCGLRSLRRDRCCGGGLGRSAGDGLRADHGDRRRDGMSRRGRCVGRCCGSRGRRLGVVFLQDGPPLLVDGVAVHLELLVELFNEPGIGSEPPVAVDAGHLVRHARSPSFIAEALWCGRRRRMRSGPHTLDQQA